MTLTVLHFCRHASTCKPFEPVSGPHVWYRSDYEDVDSYSYRLSEADIAEIAKAVSAVRNKGLELKVNLLPFLFAMLLACQL